MPKRCGCVDKRKDEFLGILAHELRNPLAPMRFALEILRRADGDADQMTRARQVLDRQVTHMVRIVDDLLDVSRITQGKVELRKERLELGRPRQCGRGTLPAGDRRGASHLDDFAAGRDRDARRRCGPPDAGAREPPEQCDQVHAARRPHLADRRNERRAGRRSGPGPHSHSRYRRRDRPRRCCRRSSTCSCRAMCRWSGRGRASASA